MTPSSTEPGAQSERLSAADKLAEAIAALTHQTDAYVERIMLARPDIHSAIAARLLARLTRINYCLQDGQASLGPNAEEMLSLRLSEAMAASSTEQLGKGGLGKSEQGAVPKRQAIIKQEITKMIRDTINHKLEELEVVEYSDGGLVVRKSLTTSAPDPVIVQATFGLEGGKISKNYTASVIKSSGIGPSRQSDEFTIDPELYDEYGVAPADLLPQLSLAFGDTIKDLQELNFFGQKPTADTL